MSEQNTGGPAFPFVDSHDAPSHSGMTLRDYFAAKAMPVAMETLSQDWDKDLGEDWFWNTIEIDMLAEHSYLIADAMLKARQA